MSLHGTLTFGLFMPFIFTTGCGQLGSSDLESVEGPGWTVLRPWTLQSIPPKKALTTTLSAKSPSTIRVDYEIESGKELNLYFMTLEQDRRASAGKEPRELGKDFISLDRGLVANGRSEHQAGQGQFAIAFRNLGSASVALRVRVIYRMGN
jgi:hypothetical protein